MTRFRDHLRDVQQGFRRDAAAIDADAAGIRFWIDQRGRKAEIGGEKRRGVAARAATDDNNLNGNHEPEMQPRKHEGTKKSRAFVAKTLVL